MLFLIFKSLYDVRYSFLSLIIAGTLILSHPLSTFIVLISTVLLFFGSLISDHILKINKNYIKIKYSFLLFFGISIIFYWSNIYYNSSNTLFFILLKSLNKATNIDQEFTGLVYIPSDFFLNRCGLLISIIMLGLGLLYWLNRYQITKARLSLIISIIGLIIVSYGSSIANIDMIIADRWAVFLFIAGAPFLGQTIILLTKIRQNKIIPIFFLLYCLLVINNNSVNLFTPFYGNQSLDPIRYSFLQSELDAAKTISRIFNNFEGFIFSDVFYATSVLPAVNINPDRLRIPDSKMQLYDVMILRHYIITHPGELNPKSKQNKPTLISDGSNHNMIYNDKSVYAYIYKNPFE